MVFNLSSNRDASSAAGHPRSRAAGDARQARANRQHRRPGEGPRQISAGTEDARQRPDPRRRQPRGCGLSGPGRIDALRRGQRRRAPHRVDHRGFGGNPARRRAADVELRPYDTLVIKPIPMWMEPGFIEVAGEVRFPGKYPIHQGETLHSVLVRAGGFDDVAFPEGAVFIREELKKREKDQIELLANRLQSDLAALSLEVVAGSASGERRRRCRLGESGTGDRPAIAVATARHRSPWAAWSSMPRARLKGRAGGPYDVVAQRWRQAGDPEEDAGRHDSGRGAEPDVPCVRAGTQPRRLHRRRAAEPLSTRIESASMSCAPTAMSFPAAAPDGSGAPHDMEIHPGDTIVVPLDTMKVPLLPLVQAVTTIIYNLAIGYILVHEYL